MGSDPEARHRTLRQGDAMFIRNANDKAANPSIGLTVTVMNGRSKSGDRENGEFRSRHRDPLAPSRGTPVAFRAGYSSQGMV
jgi:hypothetical protein